MRLRFTQAATGDIEGIYEYVAETNRAAARAIVERIESAIGGLLQHPRKGRPGRVAGTRELIIQGAPYLVAYTIGEDVIEVVAVLHGARAWPTSF